MPDPRADAPDPDRSVRRPTDVGRFGARRRVAVVRGGRWDSTQAAPRVVQVLRESGFEVTVLYWDHTGREPDREVVDGLPIIAYKHRIAHAGIRYFLAWPLWWRWLARQFRRGRYDIVHVMNVDSAVPAVLSRRRCGHRIVYDIRDAWGLSLTNRMFPAPQILTWLDRVFSHRVDGILLSQGMLEFCARYHGRKAAERVAAIQVLNVPSYDAGADGYRRPGSSDPLVLNYSGRISQYRGAYLVPDAIKNTPWRLHVYGKNTSPEIQQYLEATPRTTLEGLVPLETSLRYLDQSDLVAILYDTARMVSRVSSANKMFEAMMLGKPYVCTEGTFPACVAAEYRLGWALPYGDEQALRELLGDLAAHPEKLAEAGRRGREAYEEHFRWARQRQNLIDLYRYLLGYGDVVPRECMGWKRFIGKGYSFAMTDSET